MPRKRRSPGKIASTVSRLRPRWDGLMMCFRHPAGQGYSRSGRRRRGPLRQFRPRRGSVPRADRCGETWIASSGRSMAQRSACRPPAIPHRTTSVRVRRATSGATLTANERPLGTPARTARAYRPPPTRLRTAGDAYLLQMSFPETRCECPGVKPEDPGCPTPVCARLRGSPPQPLLS